MHLSDGRRGERRSIEVLEESLNRRAKLMLNDLHGFVSGERRYALLKMLKLADNGIWQQIALDAQELTEFDKRRT